MGRDHYDLRACVGECCKIGLKKQCENVDYIHVTWDQDHWRALLNK
jgi:hypothetical protein